MKMSASTEHACDRYSQSAQADPSVLQFTRWRRRPVWSRQRRRVPTCQLQTVSCLPTLRPSQWWGLRSHRLFPGGETSACLWVCGRYLQLLCAIYRFFCPVSSCTLFSSLVGVAGETSCLMPDVSAVSANVMWRQFVVSSWSFVCSTIAEMKTLRVSSGSSSHHQRTDVNPKHYSTTLVRFFTLQQHEWAFVKKDFASCESSVVDFYTFSYVIPLFNTLRSVHSCSKGQEG